MSKRFRHRFVFNIYDDTQIDREIIDYIAGSDNGHARQESIRMLLRAGFSTLVKNQDSDSAKIQSIDQSALMVALQTLNSITGGAGFKNIARDESQPNKNNFDRVEKSSEKPKNRIKDESKNFYQSELKIDETKRLKPKIIEDNYLEQDSDNRDMSDSFDEDDLIDPLSQLNGVGGLL